MKNFTLCLAVYLLHAASSFAQPGTLDSTFGVNGQKKIHFGFANSLAILPDGKFLAAGSYGSNFGLMRIKSNGGGRDKTFAGNGMVTTDFGGSDEVAYSIAIQTDGKIVVAGYTSINSYDFALARYLREGKADSAFGVNGKVTTDFGGRDIGYSVTLQADEKIVVAGFTNGNGNDLALVRYKNNGILDSTFGVNGKITTDFGGSDVAHSVAIQKDGKIVVAGSYNHNFLVARYMQDGTIDTSFGVHGRTITNFGGSDVAYSIAIQQDKKIVVAGTANVHLNYDFALARYKQNGKLDTTFGVNGIATTGFGSFDNGRSVAIQADGKIVVGGYSGRHSTGSNFFLARYQQNGKLDSVFGVNGKVITNLARHDQGQSVAIQPDGKIVMVGYTGGNLEIVRYIGGDSTAVASNRDNNFSNLEQENNLNKASNISISPNPVRDILFIQCLSSYRKTISVIDNDGRILQSANTSNGRYSFNVKQLPAGIYFIRINEKRKTITLKFIKE